MTREELKKYEPLWDKWYVQEHLGGGSYGDVYRISCQIYERTYEAALKVISIPRDQSELREIEMSCETIEDTKTYYDQLRQSITSEIDMMEQLKGRTNIVSYEDHDIIPHNQGKDPGYDIFIRMELLEDFNSVIGRESRQWKDNTQIRKLGMDIAQGLKICHSHSIIHRDIKLNNIFRSADGDFKIGDFGIARNVSDSQLTMSIKGTFNFMAPEVYNREHYDYRVDIYSLGMVMYQLLNKNRGPFLSLNQVPTADEREQALIRRMSGEELPAPVMAGEKLADVVLKACAFKKEDRYDNMEEFYRALLMLEKDDLERPDSSMAESGSVDNVKDDSEDLDQTVPFVQNIDLSTDRSTEQHSNQGIDLAKELGYEPPVSESVAEPVAEPVEEPVAEPVVETVEEPVSEPVAESVVEPVEEEAAPIEDAGHVTREKKRFPIWIVPVAAVALIAVLFLAIGSGKKSTGQKDDIAKETTYTTEEESEVFDEDPVEPVCMGEITVTGDPENEEGLIFENDSFDTISISGDFQASYDDTTPVEGELVLEHTGDVIEKSGTFNWVFTPTDTENYLPVEDEIFVTAVHRDYVDFDELEKMVDEMTDIREMGSIYQLDLSNINFKDENMSMLAAMTNLTVLVLSNDNLTDISVLSKLSRLQQVYLDGNSDLKDVSPLYDLKNLTVVDLTGTSVSKADKKKIESILVTE